MLCPDIHGPDHAGPKVAELEGPGSAGEEILELDIPVGDWGVAGMQVFYRRCTVVECGPDAGFLKITTLAESDEFR